VPAAVVPENEPDVSAAVQSLNSGHGTTDVSDVFKKPEPPVAATDAVLLTRRQR
jgi:hypothetical protein